MDNIYIFYIFYISIMQSLKNEIINLRKKIYLKQKKYMENIYYNNFSVDEKKKANGEIFLLEEILDTKNKWYDLELKKFWTL